MKFKETYHGRLLAAYAAGQAAVESELEAIYAELSDGLNGFLGHRPLIETPFLAAALRLAADALEGQLNTAGRELEKTLLLRMSAVTGHGKLEDSHADDA